MEKCKRVGWEEYALALAFTASTRSEDPWFKVGACVLRSDNSVAGVGYNGAPPGIELDWSDRDDRRKYVLHAELNALRYCTLNDTTDGTIATTHPPCEECLKTIAAYGIKKIIFNGELNWSIYDKKMIHKIAKKFFITMKKVEKPNA